MNIFIMGGGRVGSHIAQMLSEEEYDITVIEKNPDDQERLDLSLNARIVLGDGTSALLMQSLDVGEADLFIACTGNDESNLIAAAAAKGLGARQVLARVEKPIFVEESVLFEGFLNIDYMLSPDALVAQEIVNYIVYPGVLAAEDFAQNKIQLRQVQVSANASAANHPLSDTLPPGGGVLVGVLERDNIITIPHGSDHVLPGDKVTLIGKRESMQKAIQTFQGEEPRMQHIAIMGGGGIGRWIAHSLEGKVESVKLFEVDLAKAERIASGFRKGNIHVIHRDATSKSDLEQEHINDFDLFVATTEDDERNMIAGVLAQAVGSKMSAVVMHHPDFAPLAEKLGIHMTVTPRDVLSNSILKILRQQSISTSSILREGDAEVLEITLGKTSQALGKKIKDMRHLLPRGLIITTIIRGDLAYVPGGEDMLESGDSIVIIAMANAIIEAQRLFQGQ
ncbi:MAG TPA: Trk system potassium transporter TrkA [Candidatus Hydrogenedentes bacterium]|jgi:trk system potassium uptake protein TrkA|nr:Trk system potassium transporter TrkA [Candidatus Hydrogenedentota bacterium]